MTLYNINNNSSSPINHKNHTETNAILDCELYWVSKLLRKGAKCNIKNNNKKSSAVWKSELDCHEYWWGKS